MTSVVVTGIEAPEPLNSHGNFSEFIELNYRSKPWRTGCGMSNHCRHSILAAGLLVNSVCAASLLAQDATFDDLPAEVKDYASDIRALCVADGTAPKPFDDPMQGITRIQLESRRAWLVDTERLCNDAMHTGGNCHFRGCILQFGAESDGTDGRKFLMSGCFAISRA